MAGAYFSGFDAHTHLDFPVFDTDRERVCERSREAGIGGFLLAGADPAHWDRVVTVAEQIGGHAVLGLHPWWVDEDWEVHVEALRDRLTPWGIGETGLDRLRPHRPLQLLALRAQLALARERDLPVVLHCVRAYGALLDEVQTYGVRGMVHGWSGPPELVDRAVSLGLSLSFGPDLLRSERVRACAERVPLDQLLLETDCPDRPIPGARRGEPVHLVPIAERLGRLRGLSTDEVLSRTGHNARRWLRAEG